MGDGDFAVVPSSLIDSDNACFFLPSCADCATVPRLYVHPLSDTLTLVADATKWGDSQTCHEIEPLLVDSLQAETDSVHASQYDNRLYVCVTKDNALVYVNRFTVNCKEDTLYHILAAYKAAEMDRMRQAVFTRGEIDKEYIKKYIARCE